jgi:CRP-like cAMP-binding protein
MNKNSQSIIRALFTKGQPLFFSKREVILGNEEVPDGVYFLGSGYIKEYSINDEGSQLLNIIYGPGEVFPFVWAYLGVDIKSIFYEAITDVTVWRIATVWFKKYRETDIEVSNALAVQLGLQYRNLKSRINNLEYNKASQRVAYRLLALAKRFGEKTRNGIMIDPQLTHEALASTINLSRESFSREIEKLAERGVINSDNRHITVVDFEALFDAAGRPTVF